MKSSERDKIEGALYKVGGRVLQAIGSLSGDRKKKIKGRLGRGKGTVKDRESRLKGFLSNRLDLTIDRATLLFTMIRRPLLARGVRWRGKGGNLCFGR
jgi:uncharacterized protein YjbJ (UPF0337 family)